MKQARWTSRSDFSRRESGFTLLEILLVVVIISMLVTVAVVELAPRGKDAQRTAARDQIHNYQTALDLYELDNGFLPTSEQGLQALITQPSSQPAPNNWKGPYIRPPILRKDPWGHEFIYKNPGQHTPGSYEIYSPGPDGTEGNDDDIGSWQ